MRHRNWRSLSIHSHHVVILLFSSLLNSFINWLDTIEFCGLLVSYSTLIRELFLIHWSHLLPTIYWFLRFLFLILGHRYRTWVDLCIFILYSYSCTYFIFLFCLHTHIFDLYFYFVFYSYDFFIFYVFIPYSCIPI